MFCQVALISLIAGVFAAPPVDVVPLEKQQPTVIPIVSQSDELESNGTYHFSYETGNGIKREEIAYEKVIPKARSANSNEGGEDDGESDEIHVQQGSYSYTGPDGRVYTVRYIADENGFQPIGDHLPRVPGNSQSSSAEKSGRALKSNDNTESASSPKQVQAVVPPPASPVESKPDSSIQTAEPSVTSDSDAKSSDNVDARVAEAPIAPIVANKASETVPANEPTSTEAVSYTTTEKLESSVSTDVPTDISTAEPKVSTAASEVSTEGSGDISSTTSTSDQVSTLATGSEEVSSETQQSTTVPDQASSNADPSTIDGSTTTVSA